MRGSSGVLQQPSTISMSVFGSTLVIMAQRTSLRLVGSMSSSTTTNGDLGVSRYRQSGYWTFNNFQRLGAKPANKIQLGPAPGDFSAGSHQGERVLAKGGNDRTALPLLAVSRADGLPVLARAHPQPIFAQLFLYCAVTLRRSPIETIDVAAFL
jgi:hypothetical protein